ncbi:MAG: hypothetical protein M3R00_00020 [Pseudomonadota bacterium]|nr:hypothetical protein [Pseudomonadota bacterium]
MKKITVNTTVPAVSDKLIALAHTVSQQGSLADLSDDQLDAITYPDSIVGLVTLLNSVDKSSQAAIMDQVDIDFLAAHYILHHRHLGECLTLSSVLAKRLLENTQLLLTHICVLQALVDVIKLAPQYAVNLLAVPELSKLLNEVKHEERAEIIIAAPQTAEILLTSSVLLYFSYSTHACVIEAVKAVPQCANILINYFTAIINERGYAGNLPHWVYATPQITAAIENVLNNPQVKIISIHDEMGLIDRVTSYRRSADFLLNRSEMCELITGFEPLRGIIALVPDWGIRLLSNPSLRAFITNGDEVAGIIEASPQLATTLLDDPKMRELISTTDQMEKIMRAAPHVINSYLSLEQFVAIVKIRDFIEEDKLDPYMKKLDFQNALFKSVPWLLEAFIKITTQSADTDRKYSKFAEQFREMVLVEVRNFMQCREIFMRHYMVSHVWIPMFIQALPECASLLLTDARVLRIIDCEALCNIIEVAPQHAERLLVGKSGRISDFSALGRIVKVVPQFTNSLLAQDRIRALIWDEADIDFLLSYAPQCEDILLRDDRVVQLIQTGRMLATIIQRSPRCANRLLSHPNLRTLIDLDTWLLMIIIAAPEWAEILLEDPILLALVSSSQINTLGILSVAPQCARQLCANVGTILKPCGGWLAEVVKIDPEAIVEKMIAELSKENAMNVVRNGAQLATILLAAPILLPIVYPFCYMLKDPADIARILCQVSIDNVWDTTAKLPAISGNVLWPLGAQPLTNTLLNQLMIALEEINTPRARLLQAYLLIHTAQNLDADFTSEVSADESIVLFQKLKKCQHDALTVLEQLYLRELTLLPAVKNLLIQIEAMHVTHVSLLDDTEFKGNKALRAIMRHENARMQLHLAHVHFCCGTNTFSNFLGSRRAFGEAQALQIPLLRFGSFWQRLNREAALIDDAVTNRASNYRE